MRKFNRLLEGGELDIDESILSGIKQLGLPQPDKDENSIASPKIFCSIDEWPKDLREEYESNGPRWRVIAALKALQRLLPDGSIDPDPKAVHTRLPQLNKLLKMRTTIALKR
jgi:hypothetical protein